MARHQKLCRLPSLLSQLFKRLLRLLRLLRSLRLQQLLRHRQNLLRVQNAKQLHRFQKFEN